MIGSDVPVMARRVSRSEHSHVSVEDGVDPDFFPKERFRATLGVVLARSS
jgi:hypothetical protein